MITITNNGPLIKRTNYWNSQYAKWGAIYLSLNAGAWRILVPPAQAAAMLAEMRTGKEVIFSRGPWPEQNRADALEVMFDDGSDGPFALHIGQEQWDVLPTGIETEHSCGFPGIVRVLCASAADVVHHCIAAPAWFAHPAGRRSLREPRPPHHHVLHVGPAQLENRSDIVDGQEVVAHEVGSSASLPSTLQAVSSSIAAMCLASSGDKRTEAPLMLTATMWSPSFDPVPTAQDGVGGVNWVQSVALMV